MPGRRQRQQLSLLQGAPVKPIRIPSARSSRGMTLVELLVAMTIGLFLIIMVVTVLISTTTSSRVSVLTAQMNEDAALAIELLQEQIRLSGFSGQTAGARHFTGVPLIGCDSGFTPASESGPFDQLACNPGNGADSLAVRYEGTGLNSQLVGNVPPLLPADCTSSGVAAADPGTGTAISLIDNRFYIENDAGNANTPSLYCRGSDGAGGFNQSSALIPNIEDLQFRYAVTRMPVAGQVMPHQVTAHVDASDPALGNVLLNWSRVAAVHICLVARSAQPVPLGDNQVVDVGRFVDCNDVVQNPMDRFVRRSYRTTVFLRNARPAVPAAFELNGVVVQNPYRHLSSSN
ncbi:PilW family protein [Hydrogenophaga sp.]|uniref:PilW family protein n=1 Tax=Hydrogenophaga sp. TaxID=1904254 RepID=UPI0039FCBEF9